MNIFLNLWENFFQASKMQIQVTMYILEVKSTNQKNSSLDFVDYKALTKTTLLEKINELMADPKLRSIFGTPDRILKNHPRGSYFWLTNRPVVFVGTFFFLENKEELVQMVEEQAISGKVL